MPLRRRRGSDEQLPGSRGVPPASGHGPLPGAAARPAQRGADEPPELVELAVGFDRFGAGALVARLEAEGIPVRLLTMDDHGLVVGMVARFPHRLLIRADDEDRVREIIARTS